MSPRGNEGTEVLAVPHCGFVYIICTTSLGSSAAFFRGSGRRGELGTQIPRVP